LLSLKGREIVRNKFIVCGSILPAIVAGFIINAFVAAPARAGLLNFDFTLTNNVGYGVPGTVTGIIEGLSANGTGAASDVIVTSAPAALGNLVGATFPLDVSTAWSYNGYNSFTTVNGQITAAEFDQTTLPVISPNGILQLNYYGFSEFSLDGNTTRVANNGGFGGLSFTPVPEPHTFAVAGLVFPILGFWMWKKRQSAAIKAV
jgi:hypothetical protein